MGSQSAAPLCALWLLLVASTAGEGRRLHAALSACGWTGARVSPQRRRPPRGADNGVARASVAPAAAGRWLSLLNPEQNTANGKHLAGASDVGASTSFGSRRLLSNGTASGGDDEVVAAIAHGWVPARTRFPYIAAL